MGRHVAQSIVSYCSKVASIFIIYLQCTRVFIWYGAICPWASFAHNSVVPIYRLVFLGFLILLLRWVARIYYTTLCLC
jgi:hypothetical protein